MKNVLYEETIIKAEDSGTGEDPTKVILTEETNGYAVFLLSYEKGYDFKRWFTNYQRNQAIRYSVDYSDVLIKEWETSKKLKETGYDMNKR